MTRALILIDFINEFLHPDGKISPQGMGRFAAEQHTIENAKRLIDAFRQRKEEIIWVRIGFHENYDNCSSISPRFASAEKLGIMRKNTWSTKFMDMLNHTDDEKTITKTRISPFYNTDLEEYLREKGIEEIIIAGVATDLAVSSATRDGHDRDFKVVVVADACATISLEHHEAALIAIAKLWMVKNTSDFL